ncbi:hypothetical protein P4S72_28495 [Vibrio sp. PP-XX7]
MKQFKEQLHKDLIQGIAPQVFRLDYGEAFESAIDAVSPLFARQAVSNGLWLFARFVMTV